MQSSFVFGFTYLHDKRVLTVIAEYPRRELRFTEATSDISFTTPNLQLNKLGETALISICSPS